MATTPPVETPAESGNDLHPMSTALPPLPLFRLEDEMESSVWFNRTCAVKVHDPHVHKSPSHIFHAVLTSADRLWDPSDVCCCVLPSSDRMTDLHWGNLLDSYLRIFGRYNYSTSKGCKDDRRMGDLCKHQIRPPQGRGQRSPHHSHNLRRISRIMVVCWDRGQEHSYGRANHELRLD